MGCDEKMSKGIIGGIIGLIYGAIPISYCAARCLTNTTDVDWFLIPTASTYISFGVGNYIMQLGLWFVIGFVVFSLFGKK